MITQETPQNTPQVGESLKAIRGVAGLTVTELAIRAKADKSTISRWENGQREIGPDLLARIAAVIATELHQKRVAA